MLVVNEYPPQKIAGTAMATKALATSLVKRGHDVHVVVTTACPTSYQQENLQGLTISWLPDRPFKGSGIAWRLWHLWRIAQKWKPELLQGQAVSCGFLTAIVARLLGVPSITYAQGYDVYQASAWQKLTEVRWGCSCATRLLAVTQHLSSKIKVFSDREDTLIFPHGFYPINQIPEQSLLREKLGFKDSDRIVLNVARLESFKGIDLLLTAWSKVAACSSDVQLLLVGEGSLRERLEQQVMELGMNHSVKFLGRLSPEEVAGCMAAADLFVLPSLSEPFGIVLLEAMSQGLPVIASRVDGIPEVVPEHGDVCLIEAGDADALAMQLKKSLETPLSYSKKNYEWAMRFSWDRLVLRFEALYMELIR
jgi:glycosyltransferase involved in cell wall biosynthesis